MRRFGITVLMLVMSLVLSASTARAKGNAVKVVVYGPDWYGDLVVDDPEITAHLGTAVFEDVATSPNLPTELGAGYLLDRYGDPTDGAKPFDRVLYFPDPSGERGYVYYLETFNGHGPYDGHWFYASQEGETAMQGLFKANGVTHFPATTRSSSTSGSLQGALILIPALAGILIGWLLGRRERFRRTG